MYVYTHYTCNVHNVHVWSSLLYTTWYLVPHTHVPTSHRTQPHVHTVYIVVLTSCMQSLNDIIAQYNFHVHVHTLTCTCTHYTLIRTCVVKLYTAGAALTDPLPLYPTIISLTMVCMSGEVLGIYQQVVVRVKLPELAVDDIEVFI